MGGFGTFDLGRALAAGEQIKTARANRSLNGRQVAQADRRLTQGDRRLDLVQAGQEAAAAQQERERRAAKRGSARDARATAAEEQAAAARQNLARAAASGDEAAMRELIAVDPAAAEKIRDLTTPEQISPGDLQSRAGLLIARWRLP